MNEIRIDEIDKKILDILSENARTSYVDIGNTVNLSRVAVKTRIMNLEKRNIIEQYTIAINLRKLDRRVAAFFDIEVEPQKIFSVANELSAIEYVTDVYHMTGKGNLHMHAMLDFESELGDFLEEKLYKIEGIKSITTQLILMRYKARVGAKL